jgi:hypothetical protein
MKDLIIGFCHQLNWEDMQIWMNSIDKANINADKIMLVHNASKDLVQKIESRGYMILSPSLKKEDGSYEHNTFFGGIERFGSLWTFLKFRKKEYRYILITGSRDVCFQKDPFEFMDIAFKNNPDKTILIGAEPSYLRGSEWCINHMINTFGPFVLDHLMDERILNPDVIGGKCPDFVDFLALFYFLGSSIKNWGTDLPGLSLIATLEPVKSKILIPDYEDAWALHHSLYLGKPGESDLDTFPITRDNRVYSSKSGKEYYVLHQYDRNLEMNEIIKKVYGDK